MISTHLPYTRKGKRGRGSRREGKIYGEGRGRESGRRPEGVENGKASRVP